MYFHVVVGFGFWGFLVSIGFGFRFGLSPELVFRAVSGFEFGFQVRVREVSWSEYAPLPSLFSPMCLLGLLKSVEFWRISRQIVVGSKSFCILCGLRSLQTISLLSSDSLKLFQTTGSWKKITFPNSLHA